MPGHVEHFKLGFGNTGAGDLGGETSKIGLFSSFTWGNDPIFTTFQLGIGEKPPTRDVKAPRIFGKRGVGSYDGKRRRPCVYQDRLR